MFVAKGLRVGGIYKLQLDLVKHGALVHSSKRLYELWNTCFGHLHLGVLLLFKNLV
jgi:hypothetical protein